MRDLVRMSDIIRIYNNYDCDKAREEVMKLPSIDMVGELEKIKAEIEEEDSDCQYEEDYVYSGGLQTAIEIIDKHIFKLKGE